LRNYCAKTAHTAEPEEGEREEKDCTQRSSFSVKAGSPCLLQVAHYHGEKKSKGKTEKKEKPEIRTAANVKIKQSGGERRRTIRAEVQQGLSRIIERESGRVFKLGDVIAPRTKTSLIPRREQSTHNVIGSSRTKRFPRKRDKRQP